MPLTGCAPPLQKQETETKLRKEGLLWFTKTGNRTTNSKEMRERVVRGRFGLLRHITEQSCFGSQLQGLQEPLLSGSVPSSRMKAAGSQADTIVQAGPSCAQGWVHCLEWTISHPFIWPIVASPGYLQVAMLDAMGAVWPLSNRRLN